MHLLNILSWNVHAFDTDSSTTFHFFIWIPFMFYIFFGH